MLSLRCFGVQLLLIGGMDIIFFGYLYVRYSYSVSVYGNIFYIQICGMMFHVKLCNGHSRCFFLSSKLKSPADLNVSPESEGIDQ